MSDFKDLVKQQLRLTRQEIETDLRNCKKPVSLLALGWGLCQIGAFAACLMLAYLIHWLSAGAGSDPALVPLWVSFAIVASLFLSGGGIMIVVGRNKITAMKPAFNETAQALEENLEWKTKTTPS